MSAQPLNRENSERFLKKTWKVFNRRPTLLFRTALWLLTLTVWMVVYPAEMLKLMRHTRTQSMWESKICCAHTKSEGFTAPQLELRKANHFIVSISVSKCWLTRCDINVLFSPLCLRLVCKTAAVKSSWIRTKKERGSYFMKDHTLEAVHLSYKKSSVSYIFRKG